MANPLFEAQCGNYNKGNSHSFTNTLSFRWVKTIEYGQCTDQRQRSQCHSAHRNAGNDIDSIVFLLGEEITPGYVEGKVHFNNSSIFSR